MSGKIGLIFAIWLFSTIPSFNTLWAPISFRLFEELGEEEQKNMPESMNMEELKINKPSNSIGEHLFCLLHF